METSGVPGKIQVTKKVVEITNKGIKEERKLKGKAAVLKDYRFERRGTIPVKGKGEMEVFFVNF